MGMYKSGSLWSLHKPAPTGLPLSKNNIPFSLFLWTSGVQGQHSSLSLSLLKLMSCFRHIFYIILTLTLLQNASLTLSHTKGIRPKKSSSAIQLPTNMTQVQFSEKQFLKWVDFVGSLNHSLFKTAKNKLVASYTLTVDRNPATGDFTTIQDAIDSLPSVNLVRVVIRIHAGVYKYVSIILELCILLLFSSKCMDIVLQFHFNSCWINYPIS